MAILDIWSVGASWRLRGPYAPKGFGECFLADMYLSSTVHICASGFIQGVLLCVFFVHSHVTGIGQFQSTLLFILLGKLKDIQEFASKIGVEVNKGKLFTFFFSIWEAKF